MGSWEGLAAGFCAAHLCAAARIRALPNTRKSRPARRRPRTPILLEYTNRMGFSVCTVLALVFLASSCFAQSADPTLPVPQFEDVGKSAGLTATHNATPEQRYILESMSGGVGFIDCDNDGNLDIITVNGVSVHRYRHGRDPPIILHRPARD